MRYELRKNKDGTTYYSFVHYDTKKKTQDRLSRKEIRKRFGKDILTEKEAAECLKVLSAKYEAEKIRIQRRITWESEYYEYAKLLEEYTVSQMERAPNSWQNNVHYLKHYVLYYFLQIAKVNSIDLWPDNFAKFKTWLQTAKKIRGKDIIAVSSMNHAIKSANTFLDHLYRDRTIEFAQRLESFPEHMLKMRDIDDVVSPEEVEIIYKELKSKEYHEEALLFRYLYFSGMRFNEAMSISYGCMFDGNIKDGFMKAKTEAYKITYFGYIVSEGQFGSIDKNGHVNRLPFKGRKKIEEKYNRIIPIIDAELWNAMADTAEHVFNSKPKGTNPKDMLLFGGINDSTMTRRLQDAFQAKGLKWRPPHCLRHSRATMLVGQTSDPILTQAWLGQTSPKTLERYNHHYQALVRSAQSQEQATKGRFKRAST
jgi:integrase